MAAPISLKELEDDPRLFLYTSLTAGSSHIITATSRMETILKANKIPFQAIDTATDEKAHRLWQRRAGQRKLPGLVKEGYVIGDLEEVEEWNEYGELKENIGPVPAHNKAPAGGQTGVNIAPPIGVNPTATGGTANVTQPPIAGINKAAPAGLDASKARALPGAAEIAAKNKAQSGTAGSSVVDEPPKAETMTSAPAEKEQSIGDTHKKNANVAHISAPASALQSGTATPAEPEVPKRGHEAHLSVPASAIQSGTATPAESTPAKPGATASSTADTKQDENSTESVAKAVEGMQVGEGKNIQEQKAKAGDEAGKSVED
ncbi:hypothetical protein KC338_g2771 [Hortaea werneckii]|nr:hypothetical protein KC323_g2441 [Hortaea werneckii]KAI6871140.1 hypothetical protein KC338_g2771 [Hortaea werneckii]